MGRNIKKEQKIGLMNMVLLKIPSVDIYLFDNLKLI